MVTVSSPGGQPVVMSKLGMPKRALHTLHSPQQSIKSNQDSHEGERACELKDCGEVVIEEVESRT
jgi:hypothetical protein